jgi:uncharacterized cupredoxin-like copper-binding protein
LIGINARLSVFWRITTNRLPPRWQTNILKEQEMDRRLAYVVAVLLLVLSVAMPAAAEDNATPVKVALIDMSSAMGTGTTARRGMMGYGMMSPGQGMMGMMAVRIDQPSVKAGPVRFDVTNWSRGMLHEMLVVAVDHPQAPLPYDYSQAKVAEDQVKVLGDTGNLQPGASYTLDVTLTPGSYLLICNFPGHYASGMVTPLTVTP